MQAIPPKQSRPPSSQAGLNPGVRAEAVDLPGMRTRLLLSPQILSQAETAGHRPAASSW